MENFLDMSMRINCKDDKEVEVIRRELNKFIRRIGYIKNKEFDYETLIVNLESGKVKISTNKRKPRETSL